MCASLLMQGCYYNHSVVQAIQARRRRAKAAEGAEIVQANAPPPSTLRYVAKLRLYVSEDYRSQHSRWKDDLLDVVEEASVVTAREFASRFEVESVVEWKPSCDLADLSACLSELQSVAVDDERTWVVGLLASLPRYTMSFEQLGMAELSGQHFVMRDVSDLPERAAIDRAFPNHTKARRSEIYRKRKRHRALAVFLHEWGHTLGAEHAGDRSSLLHAIYNDEMAAFDAESGERMGRALGQRFGQAPEASGGEVATAAAGSGGPEPASGSNATAAAVPGQRAPAATIEARELAAAEDAEGLSALDAAARAVYLEAKQAADQGDVWSAYEQLSPLLDSYPDCYAVQHLGCAVSLQVGDGARAQVVCPRQQQLQEATRVP